MSATLSIAAHALSRPEIDQLGETVRRGLAQANTSKQAVLKLIS